MFNKDHIDVGNLTSYCFIHLIIFWLAEAEPEMYHELSQSPDTASFPSNFPVSWVWVIISNHIFGLRKTAKSLNYNETLVFEGTDASIFYPNHISLCLF